MLAGIGWQDTDGDGIPDTRDAYPLDPTIADPSADIAAVWLRYPRQSLGTLWTPQATAVTLQLNLRSPAKCWAFLYAVAAPPRMNRPDPLPGGVF